MKSSNRNLFLCFSAVALLSCARLDAALLLYEGFNYGNSNMSLTAVSGSALGLDGTTYTGGSASNYYAAGLTFGNLQVSGGAGGIVNYSGLTYASRGLDFNLTSGTLYGSFLYQPFDDAGANNGIGALLLGGIANDNKSELVIAGDTQSASGQFSGIRTYTDSTGGTVYSTGVSQSLNTTYMMLFEVTNMGAANGQTQTITLWTLTVGQFANFKAEGLTAGELNSATLGAIDSQVLQRVSYTLTVSGGNNISLADTDALTLYKYQNKFLMDEIRLSNGSLDEVTPIPEPASTILIGLGLAMMVGRFRRFSRSIRRGEGI